MPTPSLGTMATENGILAQIEASVPTLFATFANDEDRFRLELERTQRRIVAYDAVLDARDE
jgi:hypothetical protein